MNTLHPKHDQTVDILVDDEDFGRFKDWWWYVNKDGYVWSTIGAKYVMLHRLVVGVTDRRINVDHKNRNKLDNRRSNLRVATVAQNAWNRKASSRSSTGYRGVTPCRATGKWRAHIMANGVRRSLGRFRTAKDAAKAWDKMATELYGGFACLNFPNTDYSVYQPKDDTHKKTSKYVGVSWDKTNGVWVAQFYMNKLPVYVGRFDSEEEAAYELRLEIEKRCPERLQKKRYSNLPASLIDQERSSQEPRSGETR